MLYVRRVNNVITGGEKARATVVLAFDFAVNSVGIDLDSYDLWRDYIDFLKSWTPAANYELQLKNTAIRKVYRRCLVIPNTKLETLWADYRKWENETTPPNAASKLIADLSATYMEVRPWTTEWHNATEGLIRRKLASHSPTSDPNNIVARQTALWFRWVDLEMANKLALPPAALRQRVEYTYRRATAVLPFVPELWFRQSLYLASADDEALRRACIAHLADGFVLNPASYLVAFRLSELYEKEQMYTEARQVYDSAIAELVCEHAQTQARIDVLKTKAQALVPGVRAEKTEKTEKPEKSADSDDDDDEDEVPEMKYAYTEAQAAEIGAENRKLADSAAAVTLLYVKLMAFCKRSQGIKEVRAVFKQRKNFKHMEYQFYVENALHEYYSDNKKTADKVFDLAMKTYGKDGGFLYAYLDYLIILNSVADLNVVFELAVTALLNEITADKETLEIATNDFLKRQTSLERLDRSRFFLRKMVQRYINFAASHLDLDTVLSLSKRYIQYFPDTDELSLFKDRYTMGDFDAITRFDMNGAGTSEEPPELRKTEPKKEPTKESRSLLPARPDGLPLPPTPSVLAGNQQHGFVGKEIYNLLHALPNAGCFGPKSEHLFDSAKLVELFADVVLPGEQA